ncbi:hypothetical protein M1373_03350 [Candidatus Marsarchaeota archaeon]|nr:hypothetical protein [Candidatus Marsarchaeota archaeon]MCL5404781.1 hypothetical protein [Candidatus Marsarchaeota archaeon]
MDAITLYTAVIIAAAELSAIACIFIFRQLLHAVLALTIAFVLNSALFLVLQQPLLAIIQLFILVGGISTYALVGVASASFSRFKHTNKLALVIIFLVLFVALSIPLLSLRPASQNSNIFGPPQITYGLKNYIAQFYIITLMLFGISISAILMFRQIGRMK